ncbi:hypothetical protein BS78_06G254500 [Paspalum vaginatum]|nr:hypothetical protein BS78_06G254500 [Paspalum vaginatum]
MDLEEEIEKNDGYQKKLAAWDAGIFHMDATALSLHLCMVAKKGLELASRIMTLTMHVSIFVNLARDTYHKRFIDKSLFSLLGAFRGVAVVAHALLKHALESVDYAEPNCSSSVQYINDTWLEFEQSMNNMKDKFKAALSSNLKSYELLRPTMEKAMIFTILFISMMVARHERVLGHIPGTMGRRRVPQTRPQD